MSPFDYARRGLRIFPCTVQKRPLFKDWGQNASTDSQVIRGWWRRWPRALIGVPTGRGERACRSRY
jgi:putative DNA primase/helicase